MLTRIELSNFMSHAQTVIEPAAGLTVLTGPNNCGKSGVVAALQILCHNENSTYVLRHEEKECAVTVTTDDGHVVEWRRTKKGSPKYVIDGVESDRLKGRIPDQLPAALRLPKVDAGDDADFDVHFGTQKDPIFLLGSSAANAARFFASSSDAIRLVQMQRRHKDKAAAARSEQARLEGESKQLNDELECLEPVVGLDARLTEIEQTYEQLKDAADELERATRHEAAMRSQQAVAVQHQARAKALTELMPPPELVAEVPLAELIAALQAATVAHASASARAQSLHSLMEPPVLDNVDALASVAERLAAAQRELAVTQVRSRALETVAEPPGMLDDGALARLHAELTEAHSLSRRVAQRVAVLEALAELPAIADVTVLAEFAERFQRVSEEIWQRELKLQTAEDELKLAEQSLRQRAMDGTCEACGAPLDPERVVARAAAGIGGHDHG